MEVLVLSVKSYDFKNDDGERVSGNKVSYIVNDKMEDIDGFAPMVVNVESKNGLDVIPGIYDMNFSMRTGRNNKPELVVKSVSFVSEVKNLFTKVAK